MSRSWTPAEDAIIREHYADDGPSGMVQRLADAGYLRSLSAVGGRIHELRRAAFRRDRAEATELYMQRGHGWSRTEEAIVRKHYGTDGPAACLKQLRAAGSAHSSRALREYARRLGLRAARRPRTRPHDDSKLLVAINPKPASPEPDLRLTALVAMVEAAMRLRPGLDVAECVARVTRAANEDPGALDMVADRIAWARAGRRRATA